MEVTWSDSYDDVVSVDMTRPPVTEMIRDALVTARITRRSIDKVTLTEKEWKQLVRETEFANLVVIPEYNRNLPHFLGVNIEVE